MRRKLFENTIMLYILKFAGYFFSLLTIPYQTRVLSRECYGALSLAIGIMVYFTMILDFGFMVSGVAEVSTYRDDKNRLSQILYSVIVIRFILIFFSFIILCLLLKFVQNYSMWHNVFFVYFLAIVLESLVPTFFLRGIEDMRTVAVLTLLSKALTTGMVFVFVKNDNNFLVVPWMRAAGALISLIAAYIYISKKYNIRPMRAPIADVISRAKESSGYFVSRVASTAYRSSNTAILGIVSPAATLALYSSAEKLMGVGMTMSSPISDSLLPHIAKTKDYKAAWKLLKIVLPFIVIGGLIGFVFAEQIMVLLFGAEYLEGANVLRALIPVIAFTLPNFIIEFPVLLPMGLGRNSNMANIFGVFTYIVGVLILYINNKINVLNMAILLSVVEGSVMLSRIAILILHKDLLKSGNKEAA